MSETEIKDGDEQQEDGGESLETAASRWAQELGAARKRLREFHKDGEEAVRRFRGKHKKFDSDTTRNLNLYAACVQQVEAMLYASVPTVDVQRRFGDANDGLARVASELLGRVLTEDLRSDGEEQILAMRQARLDRLTSGMGNARIRYEAQIDEVPATGDDGAPLTGDDGEPITQQVKRDEQVEVLYVHWKDQLWDAVARTFSECRWWAFRVYMTRAQLRERFGAKLAAMVQMSTQSDEEKNKDGFSAPIAQAEVWEIWDKENGEVCWYAEGVGRLLDRRPPPLELEGFWPFPRPMFANLGTDELIPVSDYALCRSLYDEMDILATRRRALTDALRMRGIYDSSAAGIERVFEEGADNQLFPVNGPAWAALMEKGGIAGALMFVPLDLLVQALQQVNAQMDILIGEVYQLTGWSDIMRGQQQENGTPGEAQAKVQFASARLNSIAEESARFWADIQRLRAEVMAKLFSPTTILERSNAQYTYDADVAAKAVGLIQQDVRGFRIDIKAESMAIADYGERRAEATEVLGALGGFIQQAGSIAQAVPGSMPFLLELLRWSISRLKGGQEIGGLLDKAIQAAQQQSQQPQGPAQQPPDPKVQAAQIQQQGKMQELQAKAQLDAQHMMLETQQMAQRQKDQVAANVTEELAKAKIKQTHAASGLMPQGVTP